MRVFDKLAGASLCMEPRQLWGQRVQMGSVGVLLQQLRREGLTSIISHGGSTKIAAPFI